MMNKTFKYNKIINQLVSLFQIYIILAEDIMKQVKNANMEIKNLDLTFITKN